MKKILFALINYNISFILDISTTDVYLYNCKFKTKMNCSEDLKIIEMKLLFAKVDWFKLRLI